MGLIRRSSKPFDSGSKRNASQLTRSSIFIGLKAAYHTKSSPASNVHAHLNVRTSNTNVHERSLGPWYIGFGLQARAPQALRDAINPDPFSQAGLAKDTAQ